MTREGWLCPRCGGAHSPDTATCPVGVAPYVPPNPGPWLPPTIPTWPIVPAWPDPNVVPVTPAAPNPWNPYVITSFTVTVDSTAILMN